MSDLKQYRLYKGQYEPGAVYRNKKQKTEIAYIKKANMEEFFPAGGYTVVGQIGKGTEQIASLSLSDAEEPVYKTQKIKNYKVEGFVQIGENEFLAVLKNTLPMFLTLLFTVLLLCGLLVFLLVKFLPSGKADTEPTTLPPLIIDAGAEEGEGKIEVPDKIDVEGKNIQIKGYAEIHLKADQLEQNFPFSNPKGNPCFIQIVMTLPDNLVCSSCKKPVDTMQEVCPHCQAENTIEPEVIYTSELIPPGYSVSNFSLNRPMKAGTYTTRIIYNTFSFDKELRELNKSVANVKIVVE